MVKENIVFLIIFVLQLIDAFTISTSGLLEGGHLINNLFETCFVINIFRQSLVQDRVVHGLHAQQLDNLLPDHVLHPDIPHPGDESLPKDRDQQPEELLDQEGQVADALLLGDLELVLETS